MRKFPTVNDIHKKSPYIGTVVTISTSSAIKAYSGQAGAGQLVREIQLPIEPVVWAPGVPRKLSLDLAPLNRDDL